MENIILTGNNGSVPDPYYHQFSLIIFEDGNSELEVKIGRSPEEQVIHQEKKRNSPEENRELIEEACQLSKHHKETAMVGGPERFIEINCEAGTSEVVTVLENTEEAGFYLKCINHFSDDLRKRLADIL